MGRNKKNNGLAAVAVGRSVKEKHQRAARDTLAVPRGLVVLPEKNIKSKHQSYFQFFENKDRKDKKLEFQVHLQYSLRSPAAMPRIFDSPSLGYYRPKSTPWVRLCAQWEPGAYSSMQRTVSRAGCDDLHRIGMST